MFRLLILLVLLIVPVPVRCETGIATRHQAFEQVFANFPERLRADVHGYIATADCSEMGALYELSIGNSTYTVAVADCRNRSLPPRPGKRLDVDDRLWYASSAPNKPITVTLCTLP